MNEPIIKVLCVDDNLAVAGMFALQIGQEADMEYVGTLHSADGLVQAVAERRPGIVLLDMSMPGREPLEVLAEVAAKYPDTRVIVCSGYDDPATVNRAIEAGAWGYVSKDSTPEEILRAIREVGAGRFVLPPT
jgi:two-component system response regulator DesR